MRAPPASHYRPPLAPPSRAGRGSSDRQPRIVVRVEALLRRLGSLRTRPLLQSALALAVLCFSAEVCAEPQVAVITADPQSVTSIRMERELRQLGVNVVLVVEQSGAPASRSFLEQAAKDVRAFAAVRLIETGTAVEVWIADRVTGKTVIREVIEADGPNPEDVIAITAVELLRASLLELTLPQPPPGGDVEPTPEIERLVPKPNPDRLAKPVSAPPSPAPLGAAFEGTLDPGLGRGSPLWGAQVLLAGQLKESVLGLEGLADVQFGKLEDPVRGAAELTLVGLGMAGTISPRLGKSLSSRLGLGMAVVHFQAQGRAVPPFVGNDEKLWIPAPYLRIGLGIRLMAPIWWRFDTSLVAALNSPRVEFDGEPVASWGLPALTAATGPELRLR